MVTVVFENPKKHFGKYINNFRHCCKPKNEFIKYKVFLVEGVDFVYVTKDKVILSDGFDVNDIIPLDMFESFCVFSSVNDGGKYI